MSSAQIINETKSALDERETDPGHAITLVPVKRADCPMQIGPALHQQWGLGPSNGGKSNIALFDEGLVGPMTNCRDGLVLITCFINYNRPTRLAGTLSCIERTRAQAIGT